MLKNTLFLQLLFVHIKKYTSVNINKETTYKETHTYIHKFAYEIKQTQRETKRNKRKNNQQETNKQKWHHKQT